MNSYNINGTSFRFLEAKGNNWDASKLKENATKRFIELDTNRDGQVSRQEAIASGGLFGRDNFVIANQSGSPTDAWGAVAGKNEYMSLREFTALGLYIDGTKSSNNPNNAMDGTITAQESADVMNELAKTTLNPYVAPKLYNNIDLNAQNFGLNNVITREQEQVDSVTGEELLSNSMKTQNNDLLRQADETLKQTNTLIQGVPQYQQPSVQQQPSQGFNWGSLISTLLPVILSLFQGNSGQNQQQVANPYGVQYPQQQVVNNPYGVQYPQQQVANNPYGVQYQ
jgi:hypothetical protein